MAVAAERFPSDYDKRREFVAERKEEVAARIGRGETIAGIEVKPRQEQRVRAMAQDQLRQTSRRRCCAPSCLSIFASLSLGAAFPQRSGAEHTGRRHSMDPVTN